MLRERRGRGPRVESAAGVGYGEGRRLSHPLRSRRTAVPGAPAHAHSGRWAGGAALTSSTDPLHPPAEGRWPRRLRGTDSRTDRGRRDGRTARPCRGKLPAPSCCCRRRAEQGPAQVRPRGSPACECLRQPLSSSPSPLHPSLAVPVRVPSPSPFPLRSSPSLRPSPFSIPAPSPSLVPCPSGHRNPSPALAPTQDCREGRGGAGMSSRS